MLLHVHLLKVCLDRCWTIGLEHRNVVRIIAGDPVLIDNDAVFLLGVDLGQHARLARLGD